MAAFSITSPTFYLGRVSVYRYIISLSTVPESLLPCKSTRQWTKPAVSHHKNPWSSVSTILFSPRTECLIGEENNDLPEFMLSAQLTSAWKQQLGHCHSIWNDWNTFREVWNFQTTPPTTEWSIEEASSGLHRTWQSYQI